MTITEFINASERYIDEYKTREYKKSKNGKIGNNWSTAAKRIELVINALKILDDIEMLSGSPMSANAPYILNIGDVAEMVIAEIFNRLNGYGHKVILSKTYDDDGDIYGKGSDTYEVKYMYNSKYRCTALNEHSTAKSVYFLTSKGLYKIPYQIALESEEVYGSDEKKHRCINIKNIENADKYLLKTYNKILFNK